MMNAERWKPHALPIALLLIASLLPWLGSPPTALAQVDPPIADSTLFLPIGMNAAGAPDPVSTSAPPSATMAPTSGTPSATPTPRTDTGQFGGVLRAISVSGSRAYVGVGPRVQVFDVSVDTEPKRLTQSSVMPDVVRSIASSKGFVFATTDGGETYVLDARNPNEIHLVAPIPSEVDIDSMAVHEDRGFVCDERGLRTLDLGDPLAPVELARLDLDEGGRACRIGNQGSLLLARTGPIDPGSSGGSNAYMAFDVSDPAQPLPGAVFARDVPRAAVADALVAPDTPQVYVLSYINVMSGAYNTIEAQDLSDVRRPTSLGSIDLDNRGQPKAAVLAMEGERLLAGGGEWVTHGDAGLWRIDTADPTEMRLTGWLPDGGKTAAMTAMNGHVYGVGDGLGIWDVETDDRPRLKAELDIFGRPKQMALDGNLTFVLEQEPSRLRVLDTRDLYAPASMQVLPLDGAIRPSFTIDERHLLVRNGDAVVIYDRSDPTDLKPDLAVSELPFGNEDMRLAVQGEIVYMASAYRLELASKNVPFRRYGAVTMQGPPLQNIGGFHIDGDRAYLVRQDPTLGGPGDTLYILDVSDPLEPSLAGKIGLPGSGSGGVVVRDGIAYVAGGDVGLLIYDVEDPTDIGDLATLSLEDWVKDLALEGDRVWLTSSAGGYALEFDVSDTSNPKILRKIMVAGAPEQVVVRDEEIWISADQGGIAVLRR